MKPLQEFRLPVEIDGELDAVVAVGLNLDRLNRDVAAIELTVEMQGHGESVRKSGLFSSGIKKPADQAISRFSYRHIRTTLLQDTIDLINRGASITRVYQCGIETTDSQGCSITTDRE